MATNTQLPGGSVVRSGSYKANAAITTRYVFVKLHSVVGEIVVAGAGDKVVGVIQNLPAAGEAADIISEGESLLRVDGNAAAIAYGDYLKSDASGDGVKTTTATDIVGARALAASSADGDVIRAMIIPERPYS